MRVAIESAAPAGVLDALLSYHCINTLHTILQSSNGGFFNPPYLPLAPRIPPDPREFVFFSPFCVFFCMSKFGQKMEASKSFFFRYFWVFQVFARRFFLDFRGLGPPPGLIFELFLRHAFFARFFGHFLAKNRKKTTNF